MNRLFMLCDDLVAYIFAYYDPYRVSYQSVVHDINWWGFWYRYVTRIFYRHHFVFHRYILNQLNDHEEEDELP